MDLTGGHSAMTATLPLLLQPLFLLCFPVSQAQHSANRTVREFYIAAVEIGWDYIHVDNVDGVFDQRWICLKENYTLPYHWGWKIHRSCSYYEDVALVHPEGVRQKIVLVLFVEVYAACRTLLAWCLSSFMLSCSRKKFKDIPKKYIKAVYREYTDSTYTVLKPRPAWTGKSFLLLLLLLWLIVLFTAH